MKNLITYLKTLWGAWGNLQSKDVRHDCRLTVGLPSGLNAKWKQNPFMRFAVVLTLIFTIGSGNVWGAYTYSGTGTFNKQSTIDGDGYYVIILSNSGAMTNSASSNYVGVNTGYNGQSSASISNPATSVVLQVTNYDSTNKKYYINNNSGNYLYSSGDKKIQYAAANHNYWEIATVSNKVRLKTVDGTIVYMGYVANSGFRPYASSTSNVQTVTAIYKLAASCSVPTVGSSLSSVSASTNSITATVPISATGGCDITANGLVYSSTVATPTVGTSGCSTATVTACGSTAENKEVTITGLTCGTTYYVRGYATNSSGTSYTNVTTQATSACPTYTVTLKDDNTELEQATAGASVTLPSRTGCTGYTFAGWTKTWTEEQDEWTTTAPTIIPAGSYTPEADENLYPVYTKEESGGTTDYSKTETFENQTAGTTYNSTQTYTTANSNAGIAWTMYYGTVSTNAVLTGSKSAQMRWYSSATSNYPYIKATTAVSGLQTLTFNAAVGNTNIKMKVEKSTDGSNWTTVASNVSMSTSKTEYSYSISGTLGTGYYIRIGVDGTNSTAPSSGNYTFRVDDVKFDYQEGGGSTTSYISVPQCCSSPAVVTVNPTNAVLALDIDGSASTSVSVSQSGGGSGRYYEPTITPAEGASTDWSGSYKTAAYEVTFTATATGTYTIVADFKETAAGCSKYGSADITVAANPILTPSSNSVAIAATCGAVSTATDITVNSRYLAGSSITASIAKSSGSGTFTISSDGSTFDTSNKTISGGTTTKVSSHIYVRYEAIADEVGSATGTLTLTQGETVVNIPIEATVTCGCNIRFTSASDLVHITAANGIWVQANSELALSGSYLKTNANNANVSIRAYTNNAHFQLKTSGTDGEGAAKTSSANALSLATNVSSNTANGWTGNIGIVYKPAEHNTTETATLTVEVYRYGGSTVYSSTTYTLYGRSLPENFVIAVTDGSSHWFAVPADMVAPWGGSCSTGLGTYAPYPIEVDNTTTPTALSSNPPSRAVYTAAARTGNVNTNPQTLSFKSVTLAGSGNYYLYGSSTNVESDGSNTNIQNANFTASEKEKWFMDVVNWNNKEYNMHLASTLNTNVLAFTTAGGARNVGQYASNAATTKKSIYILPVTATCDYYLAPTNITCQGIDNTYYYFHFKPDRTSNYEVSLNGSSWSDLTTTIVNECTDEDHPTLLEGKVALATYRGQTVYIRVKSAGGCQSNTTFSVPNPSVEVNAGTWMNMTGMAGYAFANSANSVTISGLASCGDQVVGVTCDNNKISASVNQSTGVVTISMTAGDATAGVHTGTLTFTLTGGTTRTQNIQITLTALAVNSITTAGTYFDGNILCGNKGELSSSSVYPFAIAGGLYNSDGTNITLSDFNATDVSFTDLVTGETLTGAIHRALHDATHVKFTVDIQYSQFVQGHTYRLSWTNTGQVMCNSSGVPYQDCYYDFIFSNDCSKPTALEACGISTSSFTANWAGTCTNANSTLNVYTKGAPTNILSNFENTTSNTNNLQYVGASNLAGNYWVMNVDGTSAGVVTTNNTYGLLISDVKNNNYYNLFSPLLSQLIGTVNTNDEYEITLRMATSSAQSGIGVTFYVMSNGSDLAKNTKPSITNKTVTIDGVSGTSKSLAMDGTHTTVTHTFTVKGLAGTDRIRFLGWETASVSTSSKNVYIYDISMSKKGAPSSVSGYPKSVTCSDESYNVSGLSSNTTYFYTLTNNGNTSNEVEVKTRNGNPLISFRDAGNNVITTLNMSTEVGIPTSETVEVYATRATICDLEDMITSLTGTNAEYFTVTADFSTWTFYPNLGTYYGDITITYYPTTAGEHTATYSITDNATTSSLTLNGTATGGQIELVHWASTGISVESYVIASGTPRVGSYTGVLQSDGTYQISDAGWDVGDQANEVITVVWGATSESFRVPILVASNKNSSTLSSVTSESDIVVGQGHTLTINNTLTCHGLEIYPGAKVQFSGGSLTAKYIRLYNNGDTWSTFAIFDASGASSIAVDNVYADFRIDEDRYHYITLPFDIMTGNVVYAAPAANGPNPPALRNSANNTAFYVRQYDGITRETNNLATETTYNVNMPHIGTKGGSYSMTAGRGYMIAIGDQLSATGHKKRTLRFPIAMNSTKWTAEQASSKVVGGAWVADGTDNASARATNKGWNLVGNPFMRELTVTSTSGGLATGVLETPGEDSYIWKINDNGVRYITIYNAATDAFTYQPLNVSFTLKPMAAFYVQMKNAKYINFQAALTGQAAMPAIMRAPLEEEEAVNVMIKLSVADKSDKTGVVLHSKYDAAYNEDDDADYPKLMSGTQVALWSIAGEEQLANNGLPKTSASNIPLGYQAPQTGTYTISLDIDESTLSSLKHVWLTDNDGGTPRDLMLESYTFEVSGTQLRSDRFFLSIELQPKEEILTGTDDAMSESEKPYKFIYQDKLYIMRGGVIYDATGKRMQ